eukprot:GHVU01139312.1.p1 GENE.GHVU01139312.1~~GHVU01139312.1.p1  ORF type:complete len:123 (+),score=7.50 GHVU01139312.1:35-403(+)
MESGRAVIDMGWHAPMSTRPTGRRCVASTPHTHPHTYTHTHTHMSVSQSVTHCRWRGCTWGCPAARTEDGSAGVPTCLFSSANDAHIHTHAHTHAHMHTHTHTHTHRYSDASQRGWAQQERR